MASGAGNCELFEMPLHDKTQRSIRRVLLTFLAVSASACARDAISPDGGRPAATRMLLDRQGGLRAPDAEQFVTFEDFRPGIIDGQFDWQSVGGVGLPQSAASCAIYDHEIVDLDSASRRRLFPALLGHRSLRISNAVTSGCYDDQTFSGRTADVAGQADASSRSKDGMVDFALPGAVLQNHFEAEWTLMSAVPSAQQPGLEVVASPARGDDHRMSWVQMADWPDGLVVVFAERSNPSAPGAFQSTTVARGLNRRVPHTVKLTMDFVDGPANDVVRLFVDGALRHTGTSWENYYLNDSNGSSNFDGAPPAVNRLMFRTGVDHRRDPPGVSAPDTRGHGFLIDNLRQATFMVATSADACKHDGWRQLRDANGAWFLNQGDCVSSIRRAHGS